MTMDEAFPLIPHVLKSGLTDLKVNGNTVHKLVEKLPELSAMNDVAEMAPL